MQPTYDLNEFLKSCLEGNPAPFILRGALMTARADFNLKTQTQVLDFIGNNGLEKPCLINVKPWENNPNLAQPIMVDAYGFYSGMRYGYIAFFHSPVRKWIIKSFKNNNQPDPRNFALRDALNNLQKN